MEDLNLRELSDLINNWARDKGFWDRGVTREVLVEKLLLVTTEISEAYECLRTNPDPYHWWTENGKPEGFRFELADALIRLLDLFSALEIDADVDVGTKMAYNRTRPYKHGRHPSST